MLESGVNFVIYMCPSSVRTNETPFFVISVVLASTVDCLKSVMKSGLLIFFCKIPVIILFFFPSVFHTDQDDQSSSDDEGMPYTRPAKFKAAHGFKGPFDFDHIKVVQDLSGEHTVGSPERLTHLVIQNRRASNVFSSGGCLDHEVLSLWATVSDCRPR